MKNWKLEPDDSIVCYCLNVNKKQIVNSIQQGYQTLAEIKKETKACTGGDCKSLNPSGKCCSKDIIELINIYADKPLQKGCNSNCCCKE
jgi:NAD(P)H-nitrite reductase large subunit